MGKLGIKRIFTSNVVILVLFRAKALDDNLINSTLLQTEEIGNHLDGQNGTAFLDNFVHKLIVKCNGEVCTKTNK